MTSLLQVKGQSSGERRLWHDSRRNMASLGCFVCLDRELCGGLQVGSSIFSCMDYCCGRHSDCDSVCRNNPDFVDRVREVGTFDLKTIPVVSPVDSVHLPEYIPLVFHGKRRTEPFSTSAVALQLYQIVCRKNSDVRFLTKEDMCREFKISAASTILLSGVHFDASIERWWSLSFGRREAIRKIKSLGVSLVTAPNYSLFTDRPRWDDMHSMKRIAICWSEFMAEGLLCALHLNARTDHDWDRWIEFILIHPEVTHVSFEFGTGGRSALRAVWQTDHLIRLSAAVGRPLQLIVKGGKRHIARLKKAFSSVTLIDTTSFMKTVNRKRAEAGPNDEIEWQSIRTAQGDSLDALLSSNSDALAASVCSPLANRVNLG